jgi:uncharacterized protein (DUF1501 family)
MISRRDFLAHSSLIALAPTVPGFLARSARAAEARRDARALVVVQLDGGNDGINTVVPIKDEGYPKCRRNLRLPAERLVKLDGEAALHYSMPEMGKLFEKGQLAVVQGVGYPNPSRSHFESMAVWQSARRETREHGQFGWLGRGLDAAGATGAPDALFVGAGELPVALRGRRAVASAMARPEDFALDALAADRALAEGGAAADDLAAFLRRQALDAYATADRMGKVLAGSEAGVGYPATALAGQLRTVARLIKANAGTRIFYARQGGYDTHASQYGQHQQLLAELSGAVGALLADLAAAKLDDRVLVLLFSEFGRTVQENGSAGTDHGTAAPVFVCGGAVKGGLVGSAPKLLDLDPKHGDLKVGIDFRRVYATLLEGWLDIPAKAALGGAYERLPLLKA